MKEKLFTTNAIYHADLIKRFLSNLEDTEENRLALAVITSHLNASIQAMDKALYGKWSKSIRQCNETEKENSEVKQNDQKKNSPENDLFFFSLPL